MADDNVTVLAQKFQQLRGRPGKYGGGEYDEQVDSPEGEKFRVMKASVYRKRGCYAQEVSYTRFSWLTSHFIYIVAGRPAWIARNSCR